MSCTLGYAHEFLILRIAYLALNFDIRYRFSLSVVQSKVNHYLVCQPVPPDGHNKEAAALFKLRFRQPGVPAKIYHGLGAGADPFDIAG